MPAPKLIINLILNGNRFALAEGLVLAEKIGLESENLLSVIQDSACSSKTMIDKGPKMILSDYSKQGQIKIALKDSRLMIEQGQRFGSPMLLTSIYSQLLQIAYEKGYAEKDSVAFYKYYEVWLDSQSARGSTMSPLESSKLRPHVAWRSTSRVGN